MEYDGITHEYLGYSSQLFTGFHVRDYCDFLYDPLKKKYNLLMTKLKTQDVHKLNTEKVWNINGELTSRRSGLPILTKKRCCWVDSENGHSLTIGTTNSGKTYSVIHNFIQVCRMGGSSIFVNDLKGELYTIHAPSLIEDGYKVIKIDFVNPNQSESWNPFGEVVRLYRDAEKNAFWDIEKVPDDVYINLDEEEERYNKLKKNYFKKVSSYANFYKRISNSKPSTAEERNRIADRLKKIQDEVYAMKKELDLIEEQPYFPHPKFDDCFEQLADICNTLCEEHDAKQPFFWQQAEMLLEGLVNFLLEFEYLGEDGEIHKLEENQINFQNIKLLSTEGRENTFMKNQEGKTMRYFDFYFELFGKHTDKSYEKLSTVYSSAGETVDSVISTFTNKINIGLMNENIEKMTSRTSFNFSELDDQKTAIFLVVHDEKSTYYPLVTIFVTQLYTALASIQRRQKAEGLTDEMLVIPWDIIYDEFGISPALKDIDSKFSASRFRGIRWHIVIQDYSQLDQTYGDKIATAIKQNVQNTIYLLGGNDATLQEISKRAGSRLVWNKEKGVMDHVPVITTDRLRTLSLSEALIIRQRKMPILTRYYNWKWYIYQKALTKVSKKYKAIFADQAKKSKLLPYRIFSIRNEFDKVLLYKDIEIDVSADEKGGKQIAEKIDRPKIRRKALEKEIVVLQKRVKDVQKKIFAIDGNALSFDAINSLQKQLQELSKAIEGKVSAMNIAYESAKKVEQMSLDSFYEVEDGEMVTARISKGGNS